MGGASKWMKGWQPVSIWSLHGFLNPFQNQRIWTFCPIMHFSNSWVYHGGSWRMSNCHIQRLKKWIFLRCLIFKEFIFFQKRPWKRATPLLNQNCENKSFKSYHQIPSQCPIRRFSNSGHQFFLGALSKEKEDDFSGNNKSRFENIFVSGTEKALILKTKGIFE